MSTSSTRDAPRRADMTEHHRLPGHGCQRVAGGLLGVHTAYGCIADTNVGGIEMIAYHLEAERFRTHFFDSQGNITNQDLTFNDGTCRWSGPQARATGVLSEDGRAMPTRHEWSDDGVDWPPSMDVTLRKVV
jgi:hypothetical protein